MLPCSATSDSRNHSMRRVHRRPRSLRKPAAGKRTMVIGRTCISTGRTTRTGGVKPRSLRELLETQRSSWRHANAIHESGAAIGEESRFESERDAERLARGIVVYVRCEQKRLADPRESDRLPDVA